MSKAETHNCICCNQEALSSILLALGHSGSQKNKTPRWYLPNQVVRNKSLDNIQEVWFCEKCMREVEDSVRARILYLQTENNILAPNPENINFKLVTDY